MPGLWDGLFWELMFETHTPIKFNFTFSKVVCLLGGLFVWVSTGAAHQLRLASHMWMSHEVLDDV